MVHVRSDGAAGDSVWLWCLSLVSENGVVGVLAALKVKTQIIMQEQKQL